MLRTASSLPPEGLLTLGSDPARFPAEPPACYRASWQLPGPDSHRQATTSLRTRRSTVAYVTVSPPIPLGARTIEVNCREFPGGSSSMVAAGDPGGVPAPGATAVTSSLPRTPRLGSIGGS